MPGTHKFRLVLKGTVVHAERPKGYRNLEATPEQSESLIKHWNLEEGVPVYVLGSLFKDKFGTEMWEFNCLDRNPSVGY